MSEAPSAVHWVLNGEPVESPTGMTIYEAAKAEGVVIPNFCYHPGLSIAGNCRICMVETKPIEEACDQLLGADRRGTRSSDR